MNIVLRETKLRLQHAKEEQISDLYKKELQNVVDQLQAQELTEKKIEKMSDHLETYDKRLCSIDEKDNEQDKSLAEQENRIGNINEKNIEQDVELARQASKDEEHDTRLDAVDEKNNSQDEILSSITETVSTLKYTLARQFIKNEELFQTVKNLNNQMYCITIKNAKLRVFSLVCGLIGLLGFAFGIVNLLINFL